MDRQLDTAGRLERLALLLGGAAGLLWTVSLIMLEGAGNPAEPSSGDVLVRFYADHRVLILAASTIHGVGGFFFLLFVAALVSWLKRQGSSRWLRRATAIGGTSGGALMLALMGGHSTGATTDEQLLTADTAVVFWRISHAFFVAAELALAVFVVAIALQTGRSRAIPRWLGWSAAVLALVLLVPPVGWVALLFLFPAWLVALSLQLFLAQPAE